MNILTLALNNLLLSIEDKQLTLYYNNSGTDEKKILFSIDKEKSTYSVYEKEMIDSLSYNDAKDYLIISLSVPTLIKKFESMYLLSKFATMDDLIEAADEVINSNNNKMTSDSFKEVIINKNYKA